MTFSDLVKCFREKLKRTKRQELQQCVLFLEVVLYEIVEWDGFRRYFWLDKSYYAEKDSSCYTEKKENFCTKIDPRLIQERMRGQ